MFLSSRVRAWCMGAILLTASVSGQRPSQGEVSTCWTCDQSPGCFECLSKVDNGNGTATVELDFSGCKDDDISWACCVSSSGGMGDGSCVVADDGCLDQYQVSADSENGHKCEDVSIMFVLVPLDATFVTINTHDGAAKNDAFPPVGADPICAGQTYQTGRCTTRTNSITAHCLELIDLSTCSATSSAPSINPSALPSRAPSAIPSTEPSGSPSSTPSAMPSSVPSSHPSAAPSGSPSAVPSTPPSTSPSDSPSGIPSAGPSEIPSASPSRIPSASPSGIPSAGPSGIPSASPSGIPSAGPSGIPSASPSGIPSAIPSAEPSASPSDMPTAFCFNQPDKVCREAVNACDVEETCEKDECVCDFKYTEAYSLKCGNTVYLCGIPDIASFECNIGGDEDNRIVRTLEYPACMGNGEIFIAENCPPDAGIDQDEQDLSNYAVGVCTDVGGQQFWTCKEKVDITTGTVFNISLTLDTDLDQCVADFELVVVPDADRRLGGPALW